MQRRRVQSAENTKRIFSLKGSINGNNQQQQQKGDQKQSYEIHMASQQQIRQQILRDSLNEKSSQLNISGYNQNHNDNSMSFEDSRRISYNVANYYAEPKQKKQNQNGSMDVLRNNNNPNSPQSTGQIKRKIIMKCKVSAFPQDFFSSTQAETNKTVGTNDLSYQLRVINKSGKLSDKLEHSNNNMNTMKFKGKTSNQSGNGIVRYSVDRLNSSLDPANQVIRKSDTIDLHTKDIFIMNQPRNSSQASNQHLSILGVTAKTYSQASGINKSQAIPKKLNSHNTYAVNNNIKKFDQTQIFQKDQKDPSNFKIQTPKFNIFEGINQKSNSLCISKINNQTSNLKDLIKNSNAVNNFELYINPNDLSIQNDNIPPIDTNRSIQSESVSNLPNKKGQMTQQINNKQRPPKPIQQTKTNKPNSQQNSTIQKDTRCLSASIDVIQKTACFSELIDQKSIDSFSKQLLFEDSCDPQFSDQNFNNMEIVKQKSQQSNTFTENQNEQNNEQQSKIKLKQKNSLQKFITQNDKIPAVFRQMLIPKKTRPNSHNNQQIQSNDQYNIMSQLKEKLESNASVTLKELDQMFDDSSKQDDIGSYSIQSNKEIMLAPPLPIDNQPQYQSNKTNQNIKRLENTLYQINQDPLYNKIYRQNNIYNTQDMNKNPISQAKCIIKRRSYSLQKHDKSLAQAQANSTISHINRNLLHSNSKSQEHLHSSYKKNQSKMDELEFSFSKIGNKQNIRNTDKENSQFSHLDQPKQEKDNDKNVIMDSTFNPNYFKDKSWVDKNNIKNSNNINKQNLVSKGQFQKQSFNNKENICREYQYQNLLNSSINNQKKQLLGTKRMILDAKTVNQSFHTQLMKIQINQENLLNSNYFQNVNNK
ncbi:hypothetical protein TTHERM_00558280 (macronuclear) [Tetrahymena thermophila SB210]|uniref:Uncharacterized protein n=1 Tax=Tetrahymena thermophila (strain SB210) TaxID=312017 RepID=I7MLI2_TETTS|nr:hypothetical protein TTHERM_00558280 [Tetrahymena thermophila SB210]EAS02146.1 hypothetical protein TTHERM_00558280 [Tetrahymena thermophila SB210]|eukprot:XP_001022391.1 hypothetical protein TTHERM_00558280 [Tetrahymena thermophila SB210]